MAKLINNFCSRKLLTELNLNSYNDQLNLVTLDSIEIESIQVVPRNYISCQNY